MDIAGTYEAGCQHLAAGRLDDAERAFAAVIGSAPDHAPALHQQSLIRGRRGDFAGALALVERALAHAPGVAPLHVAHGAALRRLGRNAEAVAACRRALELDADVYGAHLVAAYAMMPGPDYLQVLGRLHALLRPAVYLEIGVATGSSFRLARPPTRAFGVDPEPQMASGPAAEWRLFSETSDAFFARDVAATLGGAVDFAFIDGLHTFDQTLRDFLNVERLARPDTVVVFHDCLPLDARTARRERETAFWTGDTWKIVPLLRRCRPDLAMFTIPAAPSGLCVVSRLDPGSTALAGAALDAAIAGFMDAEPGRMPPDEAARVFQPVDNDWSAIERHLSAARALA